MTSNCRSSRVENTLCPHSLCVLLLAVIPATTMHNCDSGLQMIPFLIFSFNRDNVDEMLDITSIAADRPPHAIPAPSQGKGGLSCRMRTTMMKWRNGKMNGTTESNWQRIEFTQPSAMTEYDIKSLFSSLCKVSVTLKQISKWHALQKLKKL